MEAQAVALVGNIWTQAGTMMADVWPILAFPAGLAAVFAIGSWARGLF